ncbi:hypothetical protein XA68_10563 [Ophiocordyceps unilateralis]|uniref:Uncharacterized protein n=1 Tax=Ophiocordyceps unilateralis TaxID=268505 RepID=A0A2A9NYQ9_OPHUN|nr:hypothetical protein XA68_10563 [Ophiocordyceps unilateralis]
MRTNSEPIESVKQFEDFIFAGSKIASPLYVALLRSFTQSFQAKANDGSWKVVAIIDWDASGFYPEYWECVKVTNNLTSREIFDWYNFHYGLDFETMRIG